MIELIFVIVILGILAGVAIPRLMATRDDAEIVKAKTIVTSVRSGIEMKYSKSLMSGAATYPENLDKDCNSGNILCDVIKGGGIAQGSPKKGWTGANPNYTFALGSKTAKFTYDKNTGEFKCEGTLCAQLDR